MNARTILAVSAALVRGVAGLSACGGGDGGGEATSGGDVEMTFWHNSTTGDGKAFWDATVAAYEADNPGVTIKVQAIQNEDMDGKLQTALNSGDAPDIFMARGGGKLADVVLLRADPTRDIQNAKQIDTVIKNGQVVDRAKLDLPVNRRQGTQ